MGTNPKVPGRKPETEDRKVKNKKEGPITKKRMLNAPNTTIYTDVTTLLQACYNPGYKHVMTQVTR